MFRCLALADALAAEGWRCSFATAPTTPATVPALARSAHGVAIGDDIDLSWLRQRWPAGVDLLVVDQYELDAEWERAARGWTQRLVVIDDLANRPHDADVLVDATIGRSGEAYRDLVPPHCRVLTGPEFAILRPQFALARRAMPPYVSRDRLLIAFGSVDRHDVTSRAVEAAQDVALSWGIDVVLGAGAPNLERVRAQVAIVEGTTLHVDVHDIASILARAALAVGAAGMGALERCCLGVPTIVVVTADNQRGIAPGLSDSGAAIMLGEHDAVTAADIAVAIESLMLSVHERAVMSEHALSLCDGRGAARLARVLAT